MADGTASRRSRFDQTEPPKPSRSDRRSRSPPRGSGSPSSNGDAAVKSANAEAAAEKARALAARINAQSREMKAAGQLDAVKARSPATLGSAMSPPSNANKNEIYQQDGDYIRDIEINDLRNRYTLTKGSTQKMIKEESGADVTTRGSYYPNKSMATATNPPLFLHVTSTSKESLQKAIEIIEKMMEESLPNLVDERRFRRREPREEYERDEFGRRKWPEAKIAVDLEPIPGFNLRAQVVGHQGSYVKHIQGETRCRVQIKGRGSGFNERDTGMESDEPMYLHVSGPNPDDVKAAKEQCEDLLQNVRTQYQEFKSRGPSRRPMGGSGDGRDDRGGYHRRDESGSYNNMSPGGAQQPAAGYDQQAQGGQDFWTQMNYYAQYYDHFSKSFAENPDQDPFKEQGGFQAAYAYWYQYMQAYQQQQGQAQQGFDQQAGYGYQGTAGPTAGSPGASAEAYGQPPPPPTNEEPPPPPPEDGIPPPPPPPVGEAPGADGSYQSMPPPPGL